MLVEVGRDAWNPVFLSTLMALMVLAGLGGVLVTVPDIWPAAATTLIVLAAAMLIVRFPRPMLMLACFIVIAAVTKFRVREATALLAGDIDGQVIFELASYAAILAIVLVNARELVSRREANTLPIVPAEGILGVYVILALVSVIWSADVRVTTGRALQLAILYALSVLTVRLLGPRQSLRTLTISVVAYVLLGASLALVFPWASYKYVAGFFSWFSLHPGVAGTCAGIGAILLLSGAAVSGGSRLAASVRWAVIFALVLITIATHERTPIIALVAGGLAVWARRRMRPLAAVTVLCATCMGLAVGLHAIGARYDQADLASGEANPVAVYLLRGQTGEQFLSLTGRVDLWEYVTTLIQERPFLGYGYLASRTILLERFPWAGSSHGAVPEALLSLGLAGAALLAAAVVRTLVSAFATPASPRLDEAGSQRGAVLGVLVFLLVAAIGGDSFAGPAGFEVFAFFIVAHAQGHLHLLDGPNGPPGARYEVT